MKIITEPAFFAKMKEKLDELPAGKITESVQVERNLSLSEMKPRIASVMGPGRSGAIASVYASHYLRAIWLPATIRTVPQQIRPLLVIDTASMSGVSLRKLANRVKADYQLALFQEPPRVKFWYEMRERSELEIVSYGGKCGICGFEYREYQGHIIPCPRCEVEKLKADTMILQA